MAAITIRQLPDEAKQRLRLRAAARGRSMEAEARQILIDGLNAPLLADVSWIEQLIAAGDAVGGVDLTTPGDEPAPAADFTGR
ncbi:MAG TPA: Arc family DNA-binding protein [Tetrasphaera sp.]|mgnify:CR=1 FL=1|uniref:FitA-like ribbon-helix-helix domain-containing protein n=1 Tax=Nostocoides sp. TaxID=1917966 RepID=UPI002B8784ED|nr:Arc family DNA-binding protein [Tetrasphaera sp.]HNQ08495.1 Arc family DNA-binding protein [Tetrasphaera sp.]